MRRGIPIRGGSKGGFLSCARSGYGAWAGCAGLGVALLFAFGHAGLGQPPSQAGYGGASGVGSTNGVQNPTNQGFGRQVNPLANNEPDYDPVMAERRIRALNIDRQKRMVADANKLLGLAKELNDEVASAKSGSLSADQLHKIAEIEKLARSVRERMTAGVVDVPSFAAPAVLSFPTRQ